jgi:hypothetical protein
MRIRQSTDPHVDPDQARKRTEMAGVRKGLRELDEGKGIPHDRVKEDFAKWLSE